MNNKPSITIHRPTVTNIKYFTKRNSSHEFVSVELGFDNVSLLFSGADDLRAMAAKLNKAADIEECLK